MKVLHLGKFCPPNEGGIELFSFDLLEYLNKQGIKADLLCFGNKDAEGTYKGMNYFSCKANIKLSSAPLSVEYIRKFKKIENEYDIIHIHTPNPLAETLAVTTKRPVILHWHSDIVRQKISYNVYRPIQQKVLDKVDKVIVTSPQYLETSEQLQKHRRKAIVIPLGLNHERLESRSRNDDKVETINCIAKEKKIVLSIGRLVEYKGFDQLIEAGRFLSDDVIIVIIGDGLLYKTLGDRIKSLKLEKKVFLLGRVENVAPFLKLCNLFALTSVTRNEAFGLVLVEALYFCKPLITTDVKGSGMNYINKHNETGLVVPPRNPKALAEAINRILSEQALYDIFSKNALERFKEFDISSIGSKIVKVYEEIIK